MDFFHEEVVGVVFSVDEFGFAVCDEEDYFSGSGRGEDMFEGFSVGVAEGCCGGSLDGTKLCFGFLVRFIKIFELEDVHADLTAGVWFDVGITVK